MKRQIFIPLVFISMVCSVLTLHTTATYNRSRRVAQVGGLSAAAYVAATAMRQKRSLGALSWSRGQTVGLVASLACFAYDRLAKKYDLWVEEMRKKVEEEMLALAKELEEVESDEDDVIEDNPSATDKPQETPQQEASPKKSAEPAASQAEVKADAAAPHEDLDAAKAEGLWVKKRLECLKIASAESQQKAQDLQLDKELKEAKITKNRKAMLKALHKAEKIAKHPRIVTLYELLACDAAAQEFLKKDLARVFTFYKTWNRQPAVGWSLLDWYQLESQLTRIACFLTVADLFKQATTVSKKKKGKHTTWAQYLGIDRQLTKDIEATGLALETNEDEIAQKIAQKLSHLIPSDVHAIERRGQWLLEEQQNYVVAKLQLAVKTSLPAVQAHRNDVAAYIAKYQALFNAETMNRLIVYFYFSVHMQVRFYGGHDTFASIFEKIIALLQRNSDESTGKKFWQELAISPEVMDLAEQVIAKARADAAIITEKPQETALPAEEKKKTAAQDGAVVDHDALMLEIFQMVHKIAGKLQEVESFPVCFAQYHQFLPENLARALELYTLIRPHVAQLSGHEKQTVNLFEKMLVAAKEYLVEKVDEKPRYKALGISPTVVIKLSAVTPLQQKAKSPERAARKEEVRG